MEHTNIKQKCEEKIIMNVGESNVRQTGMNCFGRPPIVAANTPFQNYHYYKRVSIYSGQQKSLMVFLCHGNTNDCFLFEWYEHTDWFPLMKLEEQIKFEELPQSLMYEAGFNKILNKMTLEQIQIMR